MNKLITAGIFLSVTLVLVAIAPGIANAQYYYNYYGCTNHSYQKCIGNDIYWYDSCGNQQDFAQHCYNGCSNGVCGYYGDYNNYNYNYNYNYVANSGPCTYHAYKLCSGNDIYWYDSCGNQQELYNACVNGLTCQYGQCVASVQNNNTQENNYVAHSRTACYGNSLYWYDSLGVASGLYKNCNDNNSCTLDSCSAGKCQNTLKCDGSTCANDSTDYNSYCATVAADNQNHCGNGLCEITLEENDANCPADCKTNTLAGFIVSFFEKQDANSAQWQKATQLGSDSQIYFMISVANDSASQVDNVNISANIPTEISSLGNLQLNGVQISGDIISGINIGSVAPATTKSITFEGRTQTLSATENGSATKQAVATSDVSGAKQSDSVSVNFVSTQASAQNSQVQTAAVSNTQPASGFWGFLKHWYVWILIGLAMVFLFVIVFKRFSSAV